MLPFPGERPAVERRTSVESLVDQEAPKTKGWSDFKPRVGDVVTCNGDGLCSPPGCGRSYTLTRESRGRWKLKRDSSSCAAEFASLTLIERQVPVVTGESGWPGLLVGGTLRGTYTEYRWYRGELQFKGGGGWQRSICQPHPDDDVEVRTRD